MDVTSRWPEGNPEEFTQKDELIAEIDRVAKDWRWVHGAPNYAPNLALAVNAASLLRAQPEPSEVKTVEETQVNEDQSGAPKKTENSPAVFLHVRAAEGRPTELSHPSNTRRRAEVRAKLIERIESRVKATRDAVEPTRLDPEPAGSRWGTLIENIENIQNRKQDKEVAVLTEAMVNAASQAAIDSLKVLVILESPYAGDVLKNEEYARAAMRDSLLRGEAPMASHLLYTQVGVLDDKSPEERKTGIEAGLAWGRAAERTVVYLDRGVTSGMKQGIKRAVAEGRPVDYRFLENWEEND
jgi:hypothetical protein